MSERINTIPGAAFPGSANDVPERVRQRGRPPGADVRESALPLPTEGSRTISGAI